MSLIELVAVFLVLCLVFWAISTLAGVFGIPPQVVVVLQVLLVILAVFYLLSAVGLWSGGPVLRLR